MLGAAGALGGVEHAVRVGLALEPGQERSAGAGSAPGRVGFLGPLDVRGDAGAHGALLGGELPGHAGLSRSPALAGREASPGSKPIGLVLSPVRYARCCDGATWALRRRLLLRPVRPPVGSTPAACRC